MASLERFELHGKKAMVTGAAAGAEKSSGAGALIYDTIFSQRDNRDKNNNKKHTGIVRLGNSILPAEFAYFLHSRNVAFPVVRRPDSVN